MTTQFGIDANYVYAQEGKSVFTKLAEHDSTLVSHTTELGVHDTKVTAHDSAIGDISTLPSWLQSNLSFAVKNMYDSMTEINVRTPPYNLKGDGSDETATLQTLFNLANTNGSVYLYFPQGTYGENGGLRLYKNTYVRGHDKAVIKRLGTTGKVFINGESGNSAYASGYSGDGNIHFTGLTIDLNRDSITFVTTGSITTGTASLVVANLNGITSGMYITVQGAGASGADLYATVSSISGNTLTLSTNAGTTVTNATCTAIKTISAFDLSHGENITFNNITVTNGHSGHYFQLTGVKSVRFKDCKFTNQLHAYLGSYQFEVIQIEATSSTSFPTFGAWDYTPTKDVIVEGCLFDNTIRGVGNHSDGKYGTSNIIYCDGLRVMNCTFTTIADIPVTMTGMRNFIIDGCTIDTTGSHGVDMYNSDYGFFKNNTIRNTQKAGLNTTNLNYTKIVGNVFENTSAHPVNQYACIRLTDSSNLTIYDNSAQDATPKYSYPILGSGTWSNNKQFNNNMKAGTTGSFRGVGNLIWVAGGDSITAGGNLDGGGVSQGYYQDTALNYLPQVNVMYNRGYGGYCASISSTSAYSSLNSVTSGWQVADIYTIFIGTNDFSRNVPLGAITDASGATDSFYGGLTKLYNDLYAKNNNATIIFITPMKRTLVSGGSTIAWDTANTAGLKLVDYVNAMKAFATQNSCGVIDLFNTSGLNSTNAGVLTIDGLHPKLALNQRIGNIIGKGINALIA